MHRYVGENNGLADRQFLGRNPVVPASVLLGMGAATAAIFLFLKAPLGLWAGSLALYVALFVWILRSESQDALHVSQSTNSIRAIKRRRLGGGESTTQYSVVDVASVMAACVDTDGVYTAKVRMRDGAVYEISAMQNSEEQAAAVAQAFIDATGRADLSVTMDQP
jgi:hypothetical protein